MEPSDGKVKVRTHRDRCIGAGHCVSHAPEIFDQDDDEGMVVLRQDAVEDEQAELVHDVAGLCPVGAIEVSER